MLPGSDEEDWATQEQGNLGRSSDCNPEQRFDSQEAALGDAETWFVAKVEGRQEGAGLWNRLATEARGGMPAERWKNPKKCGSSAQPGSILRRM